MRGKINTGAATLAVAGAAVLCVLGVAPTASAAYGGGGCRGTAAPVAAGVSLQPCDYPGPTPEINGNVYVTDTTGLNIDVCAQLLQVNADGSTTQVHDFGCNGWANTYNQTFYTGSVRVTPGVEYVLQTGFWATINGHYGYQGDIQGPRAHC